MFKQACRQIDCLSRQTLNWTLRQDIFRPERLIRIKGEGLKVLQYYSLERGFLFTRNFSLDFYIPGDFPVEKPLILACTPIWSPHIDHNRTFCWDNDYRTWTFVNRDLYMLLRQVIIPIIIGNPSAIAKDVFLEGKTHMNVQAAELYRIHRHLLPWHKEPLWKRG